MKGHGLLEHVSRDQALPAAGENPRPPDVGAPKGGCCGKNRSFPTDPGGLAPELAGTGKIRRRWLRFYRISLFQDENNVKTGGES